MKARVRAFVGRLGSIGLRAKIAGVVAAVVLALGLASAVVVRAHLTQALERRLEAHALAVAEAVAAHHLDSTRGHVAVSSDRLLAAMVDTDPEGLYAVIQGLDGTVVVAVARPEAPRERLGDAAPFPPSSSGPIETSVGEIYEATIPLTESGLVARVGLSTRVLEAEVAALTQKLAAVVAVSLVFGILISVVITQRLIRPIVGLQRAVRQTSLHHLPGAGLATRDEIGELSHAFSSMTARLARSRDELMAQNRELAVYNATAKAIASAQDLEEILRAALTAVLQEMRFRAGWVVLDDGGDPTQMGLRFASGEGGDDRPLRLVVSEGLSERFAREEAEHDWADCICLNVLATGECTVISDIRSSCRRLSQETIRAEGLVTHASVPLVARDQVVGVLNVADDAPRAFPKAELELMRSIGRQIGVAVDHSRLWKQAQRKEHLRGQLLERTLLAQEDERRRISLELHDQLGSALASLGVGLRMLEDSAGNARATREQFRSLRDQVAGLAADMHQLAFDLRPAALDRLGLADAMEQMVDDFALRHGLAADFQAIGLDGERLPSEVETAVYRIVQEALTNVAKHSHASEVGVLLEQRSEKIIAVVEDNGRGFDLEQALRSNPGHLGLFGMHERAALVGGRWDVETGIGRGSTVFVEVPIAPPVGSGVGAA